MSCFVSSSNFAPTSQDPEDIEDAIEGVLAADDTDVVAGSYKIQDFASRSFKYYTANVNTGSIATPFGTQNLHSLYGGTNLAEIDGVSGLGLVKSETVNGTCGSCSGSGSTVTRSYFYLDANGSSANDSVVHRIVVEDVDVDSTANNGNEVYRRVYGLNHRGAALRKATITNPGAGSGIRAWCESTLISGGRISERRLPSAHTLVDTDAELVQFFNPTTYDSATLNDSSGVIYTYDYDASGVRIHDVRVKEGETGSSGNNYVSSVDYGDGSNDKPTWLPVVTRVYPTATTSYSTAIETTYAYEFWDGADTQLKKKTVTQPTVGSGQNGPNVAVVSESYYDKLGRLRWTKDPDGYVNYYSYHPVTGKQSYVAIDVPNSYDPSDNANHWVDVTDGDADTIQPSRGGSLPTALNLVSTSEFDNQGRLVRSTEPGGGTHAVLYFANGTVRLPYIDGNGDPLLPAAVTKTSPAGVVLESYAVKPSAVSTSSTSLPTTDLVSRTTHHYNPLNGQTTSVRQYHNLGGSTLGTNYNETYFVYDAEGRQAVTAQYVSASKYQVTVQEYDKLGRVIRSRRGVTSTIPANYAAAVSATMKVAERIYDGNRTRDSHVSHDRQYYGTGDYDYIESLFRYTFRGHVRAVERTNGNGLTVIGPTQVRDIDWMGRTTASAVYEEGTSISWPTDYSAYVTSNSTGRHNLTKTYFDDQGQVYRTESYPGTQSTNYFEINRYYDLRGNLVATGDLHSAQQEYAYDGAGRQYQSRVVLESAGSYSSGAYQYAAPAPQPVFSDMSSGGVAQVIVELSHTDYLANSTKVKARHKVELDAGTVTPFTLSSGQPTGAVRETSYFWYDDAQRATTVAHYGSGNGSSGTDKWQATALPSYGSAPTASNDYIRVTQYTYNDDTGRRETVKNWKTSGTTVVSKTFYDDLGRRKFSVENWKSGYNPNSSIGNTAGENRTTGWTYTGVGQVERLTAYNNSSSTGHQVTLYQYEDPYDASLVTKTYYPDQVNSSTGNPIGGAKFVEMAYHLDGSLNTQTDQRGVVHTYQYDTNRRVELDRVTSFGSSGIVDQTVKSIGRTYDSLGRITHVTSYGTNNGTGTPLNQLAYTFDSYGMLTETDQEHDGAVDGSTLSLQYGYNTTASSNIFTNGLRQETIKSPWHQANSKYLRLYYGASGSATESRFDRLHQVSGQFEQSGSYPIADDYRYAGVNRLWTARTRWANGGANQLYLHYDGAALGDTTRGYDRFGQVIGHSTSGSAGASSFAYTYDYAGNRLTRDAITSTNNVWDQKYAYDDLLRLATSDEGTLSSGSISSPTFEEDYALDQLGNWQTLVKKTGGSTTLDQNRTHNEANEVGTIGASTGTNWADPVHDHAGNMTTIPQPKAPASGYTAIYDAWNRLVSLSSGSNVQANQYDGLHRRIVRDETGGGGSVRHFYYNENWQCVEERDGSYAFVKRHFWHPYYIDALAASIDSTGERVSFVHDANFNVTMAVNDTWNAATVIERYHYSPYGEVTYLNPDFSEKGTQESEFGNEFLYTGRRLDPETWLYQFRTRYYHGQLGRFTGRDWIRYNGGMNLYGYVGGNPTRHVDPFGYEGWCPDYLQGKEGWCPDYLQGKEGWCPDYLQGKEGWCPDYLDGTPNCDGEVSVIGCGLGGAARGACNIGCLLKQGGKEVGCGVIDIGGSALEVCSGGYYRHDDWSCTMQGLNSGDIDVGNYYYETCGNIATVGMYDQCKAGIEYHYGLIDVDECSARIGAPAFCQLVGARLGANRCPRGTVSRWRSPTPECVNSGDWVMVGRPTIENYICSGKWQPGLTNKFSPPGVGCQYQLPPGGTIKWPGGIIDPIKGCLGQRIYEGPPMQPIVGPRPYPVPIVLPIRQ